jgi:hypothetical protein
MSRKLLEKIRHLIEISWFYLFIIQVISVGKK